MSELETQKTKIILFSWGLIDVHPTTKVIEETLRKQGKDKRRGSTTNSIDQGWICTHLHKLWYNFKTIRTTITVLW